MDIGILGLIGYSLSRILTEIRKVQKTAEIAKYPVLKRDRSCWLPVSQSVKCYIRNRPNRH